MADGDVVIDDAGEYNANTGTRFEIFAVEDSSYDGGYFYHFEYYHPEEGHILRYDNANDAHGVGPHHHHHGDDVSGLTFHGLKDHAARFRNEVRKLDAQR